MYVGESERAIRQAVQARPDAMPSIIFFDEIDSIAGARSASVELRAQATGLNVLTTLLNEMDGFENMEGVLVLAATNRPQTIDPASYGRAGSTSWCMFLPRRSRPACHFAGVAAKKRIPSTGVDIDALARQIEGFSGAEIKAICATAGEAAVMRFLEESEASKRDQHG